MIKIVIATTNIPKFKQMKHILLQMGKNYHFLSLSDIGYNKKIIENGNSFLENSLIKASQVCNDTKLITIADDSGLCIDALNGKPGIYTSRYGEGMNRKMQLQKILNDLKKINNSSRNAQFVCAISCVFPSGKVIQTKGVLKGKISQKIININNGLTHDPIFIPNGYKVTMSRLSIDEKLKINHRGQAIRKLINRLKHSKVIK